MTRLERLLGASATLLALLGLGIRGAVDPPPAAVAALVLFGLHGILTLLLPSHTRARAFWSGWGGRARVAHHALDVVLIGTLLGATGGAASPFVVYLVYPVLSAGLLWGARAGFWIGAATLVGYAVLVLVQLTELAEQPALPPFSVHLLALAAAAIMAAYLTRPLRRWLLRTGEEEATLAMILGGIADGAVICDRRGRIRFLNAAAAEMFGLDPGDALGRFAPEFVPSLNPHDPACAEPELPEQTEAEGPRPAREVLAHRVDGTTFPVELSVGSIRLVEGRMHVGILRDVSQRKQAEAEERLAREAEVMEQERIRLVQDLHDGLLQTLTGAALQLRTVDNLMEREPQRARARLAQVREALAAEQRELRFWAAEMKPSLLSLHPDTLEERLRGTLQRVHDTWGIETGLSYSVEESLAPGPRHQIYRIVQEAVVNAARHSGGSKVRVDVGTREGLVVIDVADDGNGFPFEGRFGHDDLVEQRLGPVLLRHRVSAGGGRLAIASGPEGARLEILLPRGGAA